MTRTRANTIAAAGIVALIFVGFAHGEEVQDKAVKVNTEPESTAARQSTVPAKQREGGTASRSSAESGKDFTSVLGTLKQETAKSRDRQDGGKARATQGKEFTDPTTGMAFVPVKGGCFQMGDTFGDGNDTEKPVHEVCVSDFAMGKYEVTQGQWKSIMGSNPSYFSSCGDTCPVESVSWNYVQEFLRKLNKRSGKIYRLPTEAEWEYACRSGGKSEKYCGGNDVDAVAWYDKNSGGKTHPAGEKRPNGLGLYDMSGNVWEWVSDWYVSDYYRTSPKDNPQGPSLGSSRVYRGGGWHGVPVSVRAGGRGGFGAPDYRFDILGFRLVAPVQ